MWPDPHSNHAPLPCPARGSYCSPDVPQAWTDSWAHIWAWSYLPATEPLAEATLPVPSSLPAGEYGVLILRADGYECLRLSTGGCATATLTALPSPSPTTANRRMPTHWTRIWVTLGYIWK